MNIRALELCMYCAALSMYAFSFNCISDEPAKKKASSTEVQPAQDGQNAAQDNAASDDKPKSRKLSTKEIYYDKSEVLTSINQIFAKLKGEKSNDPLEAVEIQSYSNNIKIYISHPFIETQSTLSRQWLKRLAVILEGMANVRRERYVALGNNRQDEVDKANKVYKEYFDKFEETVKKPEYVEKKAKGQ